MLNNIIKINNNYDLFKVTTNATLTTCLDKLDLLH